MAVIGINYEGANRNYGPDDEIIETPGGLKYESVYLRHNEGEKIFDSGDFPQDWFRAKMFYAKEIMEKEPWLAGSSTCDHFHMDGAEFDSAYLHIVDGKGVLKYIDRSDPDYYISGREIYENGWEMFVNPGETPTWEELKERYK